MPIFGKIPNLRYWKWGTEATADQTPGLISPVMLNWIMQQIFILSCPHLFSEWKYLCAQTNWIGIQDWGERAHPVLHAVGVFQGESRHVKDSSDLIGKHYQRDSTHIMAGLHFQTFLFISPY